MSKGIDKLHKDRCRAQYSGDLQTINSVYCYELKKSGQRPLYADCILAESYLSGMFNNMRDKGAFGEKWTA